MNLCKVFLLLLIGRLEKEYDFYPKLTAEEQREITSRHNEILKEVQRVIRDRKVDLVVLDEITYPYNWGLVDKELVKQIFLDLPKEVEVVCTGRDPDKLFLEKADYVTEMRKERHPYDKGGMVGKEWNGSC